MKKTLLFVSLLAAATLTNAQSVKEVETLYLIKNLAGAKTSVDKLIADPKNANNADAYFYQGKIYNDISKDAATPKADAYNYKITAFNALKKYLSLDKKAAKLASENNFTFLDLYASFSDLGIGYFNDKDFNGAVNSFVKAQEVEDFIFEKGYTYTELKLYKLDTNLVVNTAAAALNNKDTATALKQYNKLIDAKLSSKDNEGIYDFVANYYFDKQDSKNFFAVIEKAKNIYSTNPYWAEKEMLYLSKTDRPAMFSKYEELYKKDSKDFNNTYNYAVELYNMLYDKDNTKKDSAVSSKLTTVLKSAAELDKNYMANMLLSNHLYNLAADYSEAAVKLTKPADAAKKKNLSSLSIAKLNELIPYAENCIKYFKAQPTLKIDQKVNYKAAAGYLAEAYRNIKNLPKAAEYDKLAASIAIK